MVNLVVVYRSKMKGDEASAAFHAPGCGDIERDVKRHAGYARDIAVPSSLSELGDFLALEWHGSLDDRADFSVAGCARKTVLP